ncbi:MAG: gluconate:H+ symporter [Acidobacteriota bacterium]
MSVPMMSLVLILAIILLFVLVLKVKLQAFLALLIVSMGVGLAMGMPAEKVFESMQNGMGSTLGFVATIIGLGAIFGQILESSGGAHSLAHHLIRYFGKERAQWAMVIAGFLIAIPVFFDVGFIILVPLVYALSRDTGKPNLFFASPLLAGLCVTHAFVPPTPGPVAVSQILNAEIGWVILLGVIAGIPTAVLAGPVFGRYISRKLKVENSNLPEPSEPPVDSARGGVAFRLVINILMLPIVLIVVQAIVKWLVESGHLARGPVVSILLFVGHPFAALTMATLAALYFLGIRRGKTGAALLEISTRSLAPAGIIILITGAGGVFKQVLVDSGVGVTLADAVSGSGIPILLLAYIVAVIIRISQGSATVAMITAAGIVGPMVDHAQLQEMDRALVVLAVAAGSTILSHVNDSGFWLVGRYLGLSEKQTLYSWTCMTAILSVTGFLTILIMDFVLKLWI